ncbi:protein THEM6 isoform X1 [Macaca mulatta]
MLGLLVALLALGLAVFALLDGWYLVRFPCAVLRARLLQPRVRDLLAEQRFPGRVLPSDLDLLLHMNNARYLREADFARTAHLTRCGVLGALRELRAHSVLAASCARHRRSMRLLEPFEVRTRLLGWDDRAFYLEARFVSLRDGFVCALLRFRQHLLGTSPERVVQHLCQRRVSGPRPWPRSTAFAGPPGASPSPRPPPLGKASCLHLFRVEPPELPADLQHWISYNEASSQLLRMESGLSDVTKDQ